MNTRDFAYVGCRLLALYFALEAIFSFSDLVASWVQWKASVLEVPSEMSVIFYFTIVSRGLNVLVAVALWFGAARLVQFLIPTTRVENEGGPITLFQAQSVAFAAVGILILSTALAELVGVLYRIYQFKKLVSSFEPSLNTQMEVFEFSARLLLGVLLLFGSKGLSGLLIRFCEAGLK